MLKGSIVKQLVAGVLGASLASSGLAYAGVEQAPNPVQAVVDAARSSDDGGAQTQSHHNGGGTETADAKHEAAEAFTEAVRDWTKCVQENASSRSETTGTADHVSHTDACGPHPNPHTEGLTGPPDHAGKPDDTPDGKPEDAGKPDDVPRGRSDDVPPAK